MQHYFHDPIFEAASGGAVLTGIGGDEAFMGSPWDRAVAVLQGRLRPVPRDILRVGFALAPAMVKRAFMRRWIPELFPLGCSPTPTGRRGRVAAAAAGEPLRHERRLRRLLGSPTDRIGLQALQAVAADQDVVVAHPLPVSWPPLAGLPPADRRRSRSESMEALVGDLPPGDVLHPLDQVALHRRPLGRGQPRAGDGLGR